MKQAEVVFEELENGNIKVVDFKNIAKFDLFNFNSLQYINYCSYFPYMGIDGRNHFMIYVTYGKTWDLGIPGGDEITMNKSTFNDLIKLMKQCGNRYTLAKKAAMSKARVVKTIKI
jgi:hypothetical protein